MKRPITNWDRWEKAQTMAAAYGRGMANPHDFCTPRPTPNAGAGCPCEPCHLRHLACEEIEAFGRVLEYGYST